MNATASATVNPACVASVSATGTGSSAVAHGYATVAGIGVETFAHAARRVTSNTIPPSPRAGYVTAHPRASVIVASMRYKADFCGTACRDPLLGRLRSVHRRPIEAAIRTTG